MRTLPEITRTYSRDVERHAFLLHKARSGEADEAEIGELSILDGEMHAFSRMCRRWAPLSATELGFRWGETLRHEADDAITAIVRERGLVEYQGEDVEIAEATRRVAATGRRVSMGGWTGTAGAIGDLAGLRPLVRILDPMTTDDEDQEAAGAAPDTTTHEGAAGITTPHAVTADDGMIAAMPSVPTGTKTPRTARKKSVPNENYDLFG
jgi:hypothetical protein